MRSSRWPGRTRRPTAPSPGSTGWCANGAIAASRRSRRRRRREQKVADRESTPGGPWFDATDDRIDAAHAARLLDELDAETRAIIIARVWGGLTFEEAAGSRAVR